MDRQFIDRRVDVNMQIVKRSVSEALRLDADQKPQEAYIQYLECVQTIVASLLHDATKLGADITVNSRKFVTLGKQCMERLVLILDSLPQPNNASPRPSSDVPQSTYFPGSRIYDGGSQSLPAYTNDFSLSSPQASTSLVQSPTEKPSTANPNSSIMSPTGPSRPHTISRLLGPSPVDEAQRQNQKLLAAYQARLARATTGGAKQQLATLNLSMQRRLAENMAIAKGREQTITRKLQERHHRLQQDAIRRFHDAADMSKEELERHRLYTEILQYEKSNTVLVAWRQRLEKTPEDDSVIHMLVKIILGLSDHPITQALYKYQLATYNKLQPLVEKYAPKTTSPSPGDQTLPASQSSQSLKEPPEPTQEELTDSSEEDKERVAVKEEDSESAEKTEDQEPNPDEADDESQVDLNPGPVMSCSSEFEHVSHEEITRLEVEALQRHLQNIVGDVQGYLETLLRLFVVAYQPLGTPSGRDACYAQVEEPFFKPIWGYLLALFRIVDKDDEEKLKIVFGKYHSSSPADLQLSPKFCLAASLPTTHAFPYEPAIRELSSLGQLTSPLAQLECIVRVSRLIVQCVEDHYRALGEAAPCMGADDLLPVLSFVTIRSGRAHLVAECHALEEFIHEGYLIGEEGYCLTTLQTALGYVLTLTTNEPTP